MVIYGVDITGSLFVSGSSNFKGDINVSGSQIVSGSLNVLNSLLLNGQPFVGTQGPQGIQGSIGIQGTTGSNGAQGNQGTTGSQGNQGPTGEQGIQGPTGLQGDTGSQGNQGPTGLQGTNGTVGTQGNQGPTGLQGSIGAQGSTGASAGITGYTNSSDNRILTSVSSTDINAEANLTFDGSTLGVIGAATFSSSVTAGGIITAEAANAANGIRVTSTTGTNSASFMANNGAGAFYMGLDNSSATAFGAAAYAGILYRTGAYPITFHTNAIERMRITSDGNVGIGTTSPGSRLVVKGVDGTSTNSALNVTNSSDNSLLFVRNDDKVGIGTNAPLAPFHVQSTLTKTSTNYWHYLMFDNTAPAIGVGAGFQFGGLKTATAQEVFAAIDGYKETSSVTPGSNAAGSMRFHTQVADGSGLVERMRITSGGNVGIGTSTIESSANYTSVNINGTSGSEMYFKANNTSVGFLYANSGSFNMGSITNVSFDILTNSTTKMRITSDGNVGIGTTSPSRGLTINRSNEFASLNIIKNNTGNQIAYLGTGSSGPNDLGIIQLSDGGTVKVQIYTGGNSYFNGGNVGINTTNPLGKLHVTYAGNDGSSVKFCGTGGSTNGNFIYSLASNYSDSFPLNVFATNHTDTLRVNTLVRIHSNETADGGLPLRVTAQGTIASPTYEAIAVNYLGKVGIGTTSPSYKLHVEGSGTANEVVGWFNNQGNFSTSIAVRNANRTAYLTNHATIGLSTPNYTGQLTGAISLGVGGGGTPIQFYNGSPSSVKMTILDTGTVQPGANGTQDFGTTSLRWGTIYTSDLSLSNGIGDYTIVEGEEDLFVYNNKNNKVYKFLLQEVDPNIATPKKSN